MVYSTRRFVLSFALCYFVLVFFSPFGTAITSLGEDRANLSTFVRFALVWFCLFLFLLVSGKGCGLWLWHSLDFLSYLFPLIYWKEKETQGKFYSSLIKFVKYFTMITKRYMYGTKVPNFIGLWSTSLELLKFIGIYPPNLEIKIKLKINIGCVPPSCCRCCPNSPLDRVNQSIDSSHRDVIPFIDQRIP